MEDSKSSIKIIEYLTKVDTNDNDEIEDVVNELIEKYKSAFILETRELMKTEKLKASTNIALAKYNKVIYAKI